MTNFEKIKEMNFFYKMGVMCGETLYFTYKFNSFESMVQEAKSIKDKYKNDMMYCIFVFQTFKDNSYNFQKSCFSQRKINVIYFEKQDEILAGCILKDFEESEVQEDDR